jgi:hypothetical protein
VINIDMQHFRARVLQDALTEATAEYWEHRARAFEDAAPRNGDYRGRATDDDLLGAYERCMATAKAGRSHAQLLRDAIPEEISDEVWAALDQAGLE